jgi:NAD(P)-dependent dehydrogenase (short-subunit alcohol dehydrogenase family)
MSTAEQTNNSPAQAQGCAAPFYMTTLTSFSSDIRVAVFGASGGVGQALVRQFSENAQVTIVYAFARSPIDHSSPKLSGGTFDLTDEDSIAACANQVAADGPLDIVIVATGILWAGDSLRPEKSLPELDLDNMSQVFAINAAGPALIAKHFLPHLTKASKSVFAALSARVGSIGDNRLGGWYSYRTSKAALNMLLKTLSIEHSRSRPHSVIVGLHPGTVDTELSAPYAKRTPPGKLFSPSESASYLIKVLDDVKPDDTGHVLAWDGQHIEN